MISFPIGLSPRTVQDLGSAFRGLAITKALFNCSNGSEGINTNFLELVSPRSPLEVLRMAAAFLNRGPKGFLPDSQGSDPWWGRGPRTWC